MQEERHVYYDKDLPLLGREDSPLAVIGYGNQGRAQALNLSDSGYAVIVGLRQESPSRKAAQAEGFTPKEVLDAATQCRTVVLLVPDSNLGEVFSDIRPGITEGKLLILGGGYGYRFGRIIPPVGVDAVMVAPNGPGQLVREEYVAGRGVAAKVGVQQDASGRARERALGYARALGAGRTGAGVRLLEPALEAELDLFSEQAVLAGGVPLLAARAARFLISRGVPSDLAILECVREIKLIADIMEKYGVKETYRRISLAAAYGGLTNGDKVLAGDLEAKLGAIWGRIGDGSFARDFTQWVEDNGSREKLLDEFLGEGEI